MGAHEGTRGHTGVYLHDEADPHGNDRHVVRHERDVVRLAELDGPREHEQQVVADVSEEHLSYIVRRGRWSLSSTDVRPPNVRACTTVSQLYAHGS